MGTVEMVEVIEENIENSGCYCLRSKPQSSGYTNKNNWLRGSFQQGLKYIKIEYENKPAGFIEYIPIEFSSRVVYGHNYLVIHCLWVNVTGKGFATQLINRCIEDAREQNKHGVVVITNQDTSWTPSKDVFIKNHFQEIEQAPYGFELLVYKLGDFPNPYFPNDWDARLKRCNGLTILRTHQCPFLEIATDNVLEGAKKLHIVADVIELKDRNELLKLSPTPYGVYGVVYKNQLISFHRLTVHSAVKRLKKLI